MAQSRSQRTSAVAGTLALLLGAGLTATLATSAASAPASPAGASRAFHRATTSIQGFRTAPATVLVKGTVTDRVGVRPRAHRVVRIQARRPGSTVFRTVSSGFSSRTGSFRAVYRPTTVGTWRFRLLLPATATATRAVSRSRAITATKPTVPSVAVTTAALSLNGSTGTSAKQTVNLSEAFDITGTHAGEGLTLVSGTLDYGDGTPPEEFTGDPASWTPSTHQYAAPGPVTATWTVVDSAAKSVTTSLGIHVFAEPTASVSVVIGDPLEQNKPVQFATTSDTPAGTSFTDFDSFSGAGDNFVAGAGAPPGTFTITFPTPGTYTVTVEGFNDAGGLATGTVDVVIPDLPKP